MISMKFSWHKKSNCLNDSILQGACPCLLSTTAVRYVEVTGLSPLPQFLRNMAQKLSREATNATSWKPVRSPPIPTSPTNSSYFGAQMSHPESPLWTPNSNFPHQPILFWGTNATSWKPVRIPQPQLPPPTHPILGHKCHILKAC